jgi:hypothetical protein
MKQIDNSVSFNESHGDERTLRFLHSQIQTFIKHLKDNYPDEKLTKNLLAKYSNVQLLPFRKGAKANTYTSGMFDHSNGTLKVAARDGDGTLRIDPSLNKSICHELAHGTRFKFIGETSHSNEWKNAWKKFLKIATEELHWEVELPCSSMKFYGLKKSDCPNCVSDNEECVATEKDLIK